MIELVPVGYGYFGAIYDQFRGRVREAVLFLSTVRDGDVLGVSHRDELGIGDAGDIDVVWGNSEKALAHIIIKHVIANNDFDSVEELACVLAEVIESGTIVISENEGKARIRKEVGGREYVVVLCRLIKGSSEEVLGYKNWLLTTYDDTYRRKRKKRRASLVAGPLTAASPC
jgi:hypothetical protein